MRYQHLSCLNRNVSAICLGTANYGSQIDEQHSFELLDHFAELGGNFIDTAHIYGAWDKNGANGGCGNSERVIGRWMQERDCRQQMIIGTKGGHPDFETRVTGLTESTLRQHLTESLDHLQTDYIDIYWLHRDDRAIPVAEILGWMQEGFASGRIRSLGCSNWRSDRIAQAQEAAVRFGLPPIQVNQPTWSLAQAGEPISDGPYGEQVAMEAESWAFHRAEQIPVIPYSSQANGFFAAKYDGFDITQPDFPNPGMVRRYGTQVNAANRQVAQMLATRKGCSTNQIALAWLLHQPFSTYPIIGPHTVAQLADSVGATAVDLAADEMALFQ